MLKQTGDNNNARPYKVKGNSSKGQKFFPNGKNSAVPANDAVDSQTDHNSSDESQNIVDDTFEGDGIEVSVHASEDEFQESDEDLPIQNDEDALNDPQTVQTESPAVQGPSVSNVNEEQVEDVAANKMNPWQLTNPEWMQMMNEMVQEGIKKGIETINKQRTQGNIARGTPGKETGVQSHENSRRMVKSPSDTTLYTPAVRKTTTPDNGVIDRISNFVENIQIQTAAATNRENPVANQVQQPSGSGNDNLDDALIGWVQEAREVDDTGDPELTAARQRTQKIILESEKFKANIVVPQGKLSEIKQLIDVDENIVRLRDLDNDDDFFHVTCRLDHSLKTKIEAGEFVDLEKLLPKEHSGLIDTRGDQVMELVSKGGPTYFAPKSNDVKITGIGKWEQAFRIYAAVYSKANPNRSAEIWEYVYVINAAASAHSWESVAFYDYTFRQLMAAKLMRSWAKTYLQGWNLAMSHSSSSNVAGKTPVNSSDRSTGHRDWRDDCCWRFNRNQCHKRDCNFDHHCTYCGKWGHGFYNCRKRLRKESGKEFGHESGGNSNNKPDNRDYKRRDGHSSTAVVN